MQAEKRLKSSKFHLEELETEQMEQGHTETAALQLASILNTSDDAIIGATPGGIITSWNPAAEKIFHYSASEALGKTIVMLCPPERIKEERELLTRISHGESIDPFETVARREDGRSIDISVSISPITDRNGKLIGFFKIAREITEQKQALRALRASEERYRTTLDQMLEGCQIIGFDWHYIYLNPAAAVHNRRPNEELLGKKMTDVWPGIDQTGVFQQLRRCMEERVAHHEETEFLFPDGSSGWFDVRSYPVPEGIFVFSIDITERKRAEEQSRILQLELEQRVQERTAELNAANQELEAFSYSISHDLRAPLRSINGFAEMLREALGEKLPPEARHPLKRIRESAAQMGQLISGLLEFASTGRQPLAKELVLPADLANEVVEELRSETSRHIEIKLAELPACQADRLLLRQVFRNLLSNAFKYTLGRDPAIIEIGAREENGEAIYFVKDNGAGFDMEYADRLFKVFYRLHSEEQFQGTGVGLAIVHRIITRHGGRVWAEGEPDCGATFYFTLQRGPND